MDPSSLGSVTPNGSGAREFWNEADGEWEMLEVYLFDVEYSARQGVTEFQVHREYGSQDAAREHVDTYAPIIGRLPRVLLSNVREVEISPGSGGRPVPVTANQAGFLHVYTDSAPRTHRDGFLEETLVHEAGHASLDRDHARSPGWRAAQEEDGTFISTYARDYPEREDIAESILAYFAVRYRPDRISTADRDTILEAIPHRLAYFDEQMFDFSPYTRATTPVPALPLAGVILLLTLLVINGVRVRFLPPTRPNHHADRYDLSG